MIGRLRKLNAECALRAPMISHRRPQAELIILARQWDMANSLPELLNHRSADFRSLIRLGRFKGPNFDDAVHDGARTFRYHINGCVQVGSLNHMKTRDRHWRL